MSTQTIYTITYYPNGNPDNVRWVQDSENAVSRVAAFTTPGAANERRAELAEMHGSQYTYNVVEAPVYGPDPTDELVAKHVAVVDNLRTQLDTCQSSLRQAEQRHEQDIERIGSRLNEEAESRGWCTEFDDIVRELNGRLHVELPLRTKTYEVTYDVTVTVTVSVDATDEDDADSEAALNAIDIIQAVRDGAYEESDRRIRRVAD